MGRRSSCRRSRPYFSTFIDATNLDADRKHHFVSVADGSRLDPELKKAIMDAIHKNQFQKCQRLVGQV